MTTFLAFLLGLVIGLIIGIIVFAIMQGYCMVEIKWYRDMMRNMCSDLED